MRTLLLLALFMSTAGAQVTGSRDTEGTPSPYLDSLYTSIGCVTKTSAEQQRLADSLGLSTPYRRTLLDSAGITVVDQMTSAGARDSASTVMWCPQRWPVIRMSKGWLMLIGGDRPAIATDSGRGAFHLLTLVDRPWIDLNDSTTWRDLTRDSVTQLVNFGYPTWQAAVAGLAPRFHVAAPPVVVIPGPVVPPVAVPVTCDGAPLGYRVRSTASTGVVSERTERVTVERDGTCLGVTTLATATRYGSHVRTATGWRTLSTSYTSRAAARDALVRANGL